MIRILKTADGGIAVFCPYNSAMVEGARALAGKWGNVRDNGPAWVFPAEVTNDVKALLRRVYGEDGSEVERVRLRVAYDPSLDSGNHANVVIAGREIAHVYGRDSGARLGSLVVVRQGGFTSGGSIKNYRVGVRDDTEIDLLRLPRPMADRMVAAHPEHCRIVADDGTELVDTDATDNVVPFAGGAA